MRYLRHLLQTPTLFFTVLGSAAFGLMVAGLPGADLLAFLFLFMAGGGVGIALYELVERQGLEWGWKGLQQALRHPDGLFWAGFLGHSLQLTVALAIALEWWYHSP